MTHTKAPLLDTERIRSRRRELGLSARAIEAAIGAGGNWCHSVETGVNHDQIPLREFISLAGELAIDPAQLLAQRPAEPSLGRDDPKALSADAERLGRILFDLPNQTNTTRLATALGWTADRVDAALDVLEARLPAAGQRLVRGVNGVQLARDSAGVDTVVAGLASARINDTGLNATQALMLLKVLRGEIDERAASSATMSNAHRVALAELVNAGLVAVPTPNRADQYTPVVRVVASLAWND